MNLWKRLTLGCGVIALSSCVSPGDGGGLSGSLGGPHGKWLMPSGKGALWAPLTWTADLSPREGLEESLGEPLGELRLREIALQFKRLGDGKMLTIPMRSSQNGASSLALSFDDTSRTFYSEKVIALEPGNYEIANIASVYINTQSAKPQSLQLPLVHPVSSKSGEGVRFEIEAGRVTALGRLALESAFGNKNGSLTNQFRSLLLEGAVLPAALVLRDLGWSAEDQGRLRSAGDGFPQLRFALPSEKNLAAKGVRVGFQTALDCRQKDAALKLVWKEEARAKAYEVILSRKLESAQASCVNDQLNIEEAFWAPTNHLVLTASAVLSGHDSPVKTGIRALDEQKRLLADYFQLESLESRFSARSTSEQVLKRKLKLPLGDLPAARLQDAVYFAGSFALSAGDEERNSEGVWTVVLNRSFSAEELQASFGNRPLFSAFTGEAITQSKDGQVETLLEVTAKSSQSSRLEPYIRKLRGDFAKGFGICVQDAERNNPLLIVDGNMQLLFLGGQKQGSLDGLTLKTDSVTQPALKACLQKWVDEFRFNTGVPIRFEAKMTLKAT